MARPKATLYLFMLVIIISLAHCTGSGKFEIMPIDKEVNNSLLTGQGLDKRLFSTKDKLQYFEVAGFEGLEPGDLKEKLNAFVNNNYQIGDILKSESFTVRFYKKSVLANYRDQLYEAARDTETGSIDKYKDNLLGMVWFTRVANGPLIRRTVIYDKKKQLIAVTDTLQKGHTREIPAIAVSSKAGLLTLHNDTCLVLRDQSDRVLLQNCYDVNFIRIRESNADCNRLTFINGKTAMDIDFFPKDGDWLSKEVTFFDSAAAKSGKTLKMEVSLTEFNYSTVAESFLNDK